MNKQQALKELKELKDRADALEAIINAPDVPKEFCGVPLEPQRGRVDYYYLTTKGRPQATSSSCCGKDYVASGQVWLTESSARKAAKLAELQVRLYRAMAKSWGGSRVPWDDPCVTKFCVRPAPSPTYFALDSFREAAYPIAFKTAQDRAEFITAVGNSGICFLMQGMQYEGLTLW